MSLFKINKGKFYRIGGAQPQKICLSSSTLIIKDAQIKGCFLNYLPLTDSQDVYHRSGRSKENIAAVSEDVV